MMYYKQKTYCATNTIVLIDSFLKRGTNYYPETLQKSVKLKEEFMKRCKTKNLTDSSSESESESNC